MCHLGLNDRVLAREHGAEGLFLDCGGPVESKLRGAREQPAWQLLREQISERMRVLLASEDERPAGGS